MLNRFYEGCLWAGLLSVVLGVWYHLGSPRSDWKAVRSKNCSEWSDSRVLSNRCMLSLISNASTTEIEQRIPSLLPREMMHQNDEVSDWYALVLFPAIELEIVRRCVLEGEDHPYCDSSKREEYHRLIDKELLVMMSSKNEEVQQRGMILACERSKKGRILETPENISVKLRNLILYTQLCTESQEERRERLHRALQDDSVRSMALLSLRFQPDPNVSWVVDDSWTPFQRTFLQGLQE